MPPCDEPAVAMADLPDLSGATIICSIRAPESRKPSYYHSFGEIRLHKHTRARSACTDALNEMLFFHTVGPAPEDDVRV